jgi:hypothetical protein
MDGPGKRVAVTAAVLGGEMTTLLWILVGAFGGLAVANTVAIGRLIRHQKAIKDRQDALVESVIACMNTIEAWGKYVGTWKRDIKDDKPIVHESFN